jgi:spoIIIJ-associated protein
MEWVVTTGKTVDEAKERALDQLGVAGDEAEFEVLEEPKVGFLGLRKGDARVRARVRPSQPRPKAERRDRNRRDKRKRSDRPEGESKQETSAQPAAAPARATRPEEDASMTEQMSEQPPTERPSRTRTPSADGVMPHDEHVETARNFVEGLVEAFGFQGSVEVQSGDDESVVVVQGEGIGLLIGPDGRTAEAIGDLSRSAVLRRAGNRDTEGRVTVDVAGLRERRRVALERFALAQAEAVRADGRARVLEPMGSADRKIVHDALIEAEGVRTLSEGEDPSRRVVIAPAS